MQGEKVHTPSDDEREEGRRGKGKEDRGREKSRFCGRESELRKGREKGSRTTDYLL